MYIQFFTYSVVLLILFMITGADLANLINQAALHGSAVGNEAVTRDDVEFARDKIIMGPERKSAVIEEKNRRLVAYHEGGHAIVALFTPGLILPYFDTLYHIPHTSILCTTLPILQYSVPHFPYFNTLYHIPHIPYLPHTTYIVAVSTGLFISLLQGRSQSTRRP